MMSALKGSHVISKADAPFPPPGVHGRFTVIIEVSSYIKELGVRKSKKSIVASAMIAGWAVRFLAL